MRLSFTPNLLRARPSLTPAGQGDDTGFSAWQPLTSSNLDAVRYHDKDQLLEVRFRGGRVYQYSHVPTHLVANLRSSGSPGTYLHQIIKPAHKAHRVA